MIAPNFPNYHHCTVAHQHHERLFILPRKKKGRNDQKDNDGWEGYFVKIRLDAGQPGRRRKRVDTHTHTRPGWPVEKGPCAESRKVEWAKVMWDAYYTKNVKFDKTCFFVFFFCFRCCSLFFQYVFLLDDFFLVVFLFPNSKASQFIYMNTDFWCWLGQVLSDGWCLFPKSRFTTVSLPCHVSDLLKVRERQIPKFVWVWWLATERKRDDESG